MLSYIMMALGWILNLFYRLIDNYGFAIILFTVFVKLVLFPLDLKQRKSMAKTQKIQPLLMEVQKKYANDKEKLNQETMKLYQKYNINPMGGCLPMLIQFPIIIALYWVVRKPVAFMMGVDYADMWRIAEAFNAWAAANPDVLPTSFDKVAFPLTYGVKMANNTFGNHEIQIAQTISMHPEILEHAYIAGWEGGAALKNNLIDFRFLGLNLGDEPSLGAFLGLFTGKMPTLNTALLWIIPILSGFSAWLSGKISTAKQDKQKKNVILSEAEKAQNSAGNGGDTMKSMMLIMPLFSAWFAFNLPAAVGLYWIISNVIQILLQITVTKFVATDITTEEIEGEIENVRKSRKNRKKSR